MISILSLVLVLALVAVGLALFGHLRSAVALALLGLALMLAHVAGYVR